MNALVLHKPGDIRFEIVPDPSLERPTDIILRVTATAISGSDLHLYNGIFPQTRPLVLGHEFMGIIVAAGPGVRKVREGDRVIVTSAIACGRCFFCEHDLSPHCEVSNPGHYGPEGGALTDKGGGLFGYTELYGGYPGGQAEYVRVPFADIVARRVPEELTDDQALLLTDVLPAGWSALASVDIKGGETVAVFGCGPVGLAAMKAAWLRGAGRVLALDREACRLAKAREIAQAEVINVDEVDAVLAIRSVTEGRGADVCVDAVGLGAHRTFSDRAPNAMNAQAGSIAALRLALSAVRRGGVVSIVGIYGAHYDNFPLGQIFEKGIQLQAGPARVHKHIDELLRLIEDGHLRADDIITHRLPLTRGAHGYEVFNKKLEGCVKVVFEP